MLLAAVVVLAGCGSDHKVPNKIAGQTLTIYASVPLHGASAVSGQAVLGGAKIALDQVRGRIGRYRIVLRWMDDSTAKRGTWDPGQTTLNAHQAMDDHTTIGYIGEYNSGASAISIPLLNRMGIPQISPTSTAVGLTSHGIGAAPGEPEKYYPTGIRTFARVVPSDAIEATAQVRLQQAAGCNKTFILDDGEFDGDDAEASFQVAARAAHLKLAGVQMFDPAGQGLSPAGCGGRQDRRRLRAGLGDHRGQRGAADQAGRRGDAERQAVRHRRSCREHVCQSRAGRHPALAGLASADHRGRAGPPRRLRPPARRSTTATGCATASPSPTRSSDTRR